MSSNFSQSALKRFGSVVVITLASHARGPGFNPQPNQPSFFIVCFVFVFVPSVFLCVCFSCCCGCFDCLFCFSSLFSDLLVSSFVCTLLKYLSLPTASVVFLAV